MFSIYPNPVADRLTVSATASFDRFETIVVNIYNMQGRLTITERGTIDEVNDRLSYQVSALTKGQYIINIQYGNHAEKINMIKR